MAYNLKITVYNNRDYEQSFSLREDDGATPLDLTGHKLIFAIATDQAVVTTHTTGNPVNKCIFITDALEGGIKLTLPFAVLSKIAAGTYKHDLILVDPDNKRSGVWNGQIIVKKGAAL